MKTAQDKDDFTIFDALYKELERRHSEEEDDEDNISLLSSLFDICEANVSSHRMVHFCLRRVLNLYKAVMVFPSVTELNWDCIPLQTEDCTDEEEEEKEEDSESDWDESSTGSSHSNQSSVKLIIQHRMLRLCVLYLLQHASQLFESRTDRSKCLKGLVQYVMASSYVYTHSRPLAPDQ